MRTVLNFEKNVHDRVVELIGIGEKLSVPDAKVNSFQMGSSARQYAAACGWVVSVMNALNILFDDLSNPYCKQIQTHEIKLQAVSQSSFVYVGSITQVLKSLLADLDLGLIQSLSDKIQVETFDDFLAHAEEYLKENRKMESGVIAGVVFEDTIRKICKKLELESNSKPLEQLINALSTQGHIKKTKATRCKTAAAVRGTAAHANWDQLDIGAVRETVNLTRELLGEFLEG